jgi:retron-type reverse transcriptase
MSCEVSKAYRQEAVNQGMKKVHSLVNKVYKKKNLALAWQKERPLGIPTIYDRVCQKQQEVLNRWEPMFEQVFDNANFGYRKGRSTKDELRKICKELQEGREWIVDADLKDFLGSVDHERLMTLVNQRVSDGRVHGLYRGHAQGRMLR